MQQRAPIPDGVDTQHTDSTPSPWAKAQAPLLGGYLALVLGLPLAFSPLVAHPFGAPKLLALSIGAALTLVSLGLVGVRAIPVARSHLALVGVGVLLATLSLLRSPTPGVSFWGTEYSELGYFAVVASLIVFVTGALMAPVLRAHQRFHWYILAPLPVLFVISILHLVDVPLPHLIAGSSRVRATLGNPIHLGAYSAALAFIAGGLALGRSGAYRVAGGVLSACALAVFVLTGTRGVLTGIAAVGIVVAFPWARTLISTRRRVLIAGVFAFILVVVVLSMLLSPGLTAGQGSGHLLDWSPDTFDTRILMWGIGLSSLDDSPLLGTGPSTFGDTFQDGLTRDIVNEQVNEQGGSGQLMFGDAHNWPIEFASTYGIPFLLVLLGILGLSIARVRSMTRLQKAYLAGGFVLWVNYMFSPFSLATLPLALYALGVASADCTHRPTLSASRPLVSKARFGVAILAAALLLYFGGSFLFSEYRVRDAYVHGDGTETARAAELLAPSRPSHFALAAEALAFEAAYEAPTPYGRLSDNAFRRAVELDPANPATRMYWAEALQLQGRYEDSLTQFREAADLIPGWPVALRQLAASKHRLGETEEAVEILQGLLDRVPHDVEAGRLLSRIRSD